MTEKNVIYKRGRHLLDEFLDQSGLNVKVVILFILNTSFVYSVFPTTFHLTIFLLTVDFQAVISSRPKSKLI